MCVNSVWSVLAQVSEHALIVTKTFGEERRCLVLRSIMSGVS